MRDINLLPAEISENKRKKTRNIFKMLIVFLFIFVLIAGYLGIYFLDYSVRKEIKIVNNQIDQLQDIKIKETELKNRQQLLSLRNSALSALSSNSINYYELLNVIDNIIPPSIRFSFESMNNNNTFMIEGSTYKEEEIADLLANISKLAEVTDAWLETVDNSKNEGYSFQLSFTYRSGGENNES